MPGQNPPYDILVDFHAKRIGHFLRDARTAKTGIAALDLDDCCDELSGGPFAALVGGDALLRIAGDISAARGSGETSGT